MTNSANNEPKYPTAKQALLKNLHPELRGPYESALWAGIGSSLLCCLTLTVQYFSHGGAEGVFEGIPFICLSVLGIYAYLGWKRIAGINRVNWVLQNVEPREIDVVLRGYNSVLDDPQFIEDAKTLHAVSLIKPLIPLANKLWLEDAKSGVRVMGISEITVAHQKMPSGGVTAVQGHRDPMTGQLVAVRTTEGFIWGEMVCDLCRTVR